MEEEIRWSAPEFHYYHKDISWYWLVVIAAIIVAALALWQKNFLFAIFAVIATLLIVNWGRQVPKTLDFILSEKGLTIDGKKFYHYESFLGFAIASAPENSELAELALKTKGRLGNWLKIIIAAQRSNDIKKMLEGRLPEIDYQESLADHISKMLRF